MIQVFSKQKREREWWAERVDAGLILLELCVWTGWSVCAHAVGNLHGV